MKRPIYRRSLAFRVERKRGFPVWFTPGFEFENVTLLRISTTTENQVPRFDQLNPIFFSLALNVCVCVSLPGYPEASEGVNKAFGSPSDAAGSNSITLKAVGNGGKKMLLRIKGTFWGGAVEVITGLRRSASPDPLPSAPAMSAGQNKMFSTP